MKIKPIENGTKYQVDFGLQIPRVKDPRPNKDRWVGRTTRFDTKEEAIKWAEEVKQLDKKRDTTMSGIERMDYIQALKVLNDAGFGDMKLEEVVKDWVKYRKKATSTASVRECYDQWIDKYIEKAESQIKSGSTAENLTRARKHLLPYFDLEIREFLKPQVAEDLARGFEKRVRGLTLRTKKNDWGKLVQFFNWCKMKNVKHLPADIENPIEGLVEIDRPVTHAPYILEVTEAEALMQSAFRTNSELKLLPYFILHLFCGIRPSEILGMDWSCIRLEDENEPIIHIPARATGKNKSSRTLELKRFPNVVRWFKVCDRSLPFFPYPKDKNGKVVRLFNKARQKVFIDAGIELDRKYNDCGRHSCATYLYKGQKGYTPADITDRLGHSDKILLEFYRNSGKLESEAIAYFNIKPIEAGENLVKFSA